jgi:hypothetical protein
MQQLMSNWWYYIHYLVSHICFAPRMSCLTLFILSLSHLSSRLMLMVMLVVLEYVSWHMSFTL